VDFNHPGWNRETHTPSSQKRKQRTPKHKGVAVNAGVFLIKAESSGVRLGINEACRFEDGRTSPRPELNERGILHESQANYVLSD